MTHANAPELEATTTVDYAVGGVAVRVRVADHRLVPELARTRSAFPAEPGDADIVVDVAWVDRPEADCGDEVFDSGESWRLYREPSGLRFDFSTPVFEHGPYRVATLSDDFRRVTVRMDSRLRDAGRYFDPLEFPLEEIAVLNYLARGRGVLVHACGIVDPAGQGHLFLGHSGAGKTTISHLWDRAPGVRVLSDDRIIVRGDGGGLRMYGTPWHGEAAYAAAESAPLSRVYVLRHGSSNEMRPLGPAEAVAWMFARGFPPFFDAAAIEFILDFYGRLALEVPCAAFAFVPDSTATDFVLRESGLPA
jgi:hypothetical protein